MDIIIDKNKLGSRIKLHYGYPNIDFLVDKLLCCNNALLLNIKEWSENMPLSDVWIKDKYCVNAVMKIRNDNDFIGAILALDEFSKDDSNEFMIWRRRM